MTDQGLSRTRREPRRQSPASIGGRVRLEKAQARAPGSEVHQDQGLSSRSGATGLAPEFAEKPLFSQRSVATPLLGYPEILDYNSKLL
jgi:hypothetical protein